MSSRHRREEHASEVRLRVEASSLGELFEEAGRALAEVTAEPRRGAAAGPGERVELEARDREALLVAWLNELIFRADVHALLYDDLRVERIDEASLVASVRGREPEAPRTPVKGAAMHGLRIEHTAAGFATTVLLDV